LLRHFAPSFYSWSKSAKFGLDFQPQTHLTRSGIEMKQYNGNLKHAMGAAMIALCFGWGTSHNPPLVFTGVKSTKFRLNLAFDALWFQSGTFTCRSLACMEGFEIEWQK